jgi:hypothetical protein
MFSSRDSSRTYALQRNAEIVLLINKIAPLSCLPNEATSLCTSLLEDHDWDNADDYLDTSSYELPSVVVNSHDIRFHEVTIDVPHLWADIRSSLTMPLELLEAILERSARCLLTFFNFGIEIADK